MGRKTVVLLVGSCYPHDEVDDFDSEAPSQWNWFSRNSPCVLALPNRLYPLHFGSFRGKVPAFLSSSAAVIVQMLHTVFLSLGSLSRMFDKIIAISCARYFCHRSPKRGPKAVQRGVLVASTRPNRRPEGVVREATLAEVPDPPCRQLSSARSAPVKTISTSPFYLKNGGGREPAAGAAGGKENNSHGLNIYWFMDSKIPEGISL